MLRLKDTYGLKRKLVDSYFICIILLLLLFYALALYCDVGRLIRPYLSKTERDISIENKYLYRRQKYKLNKLNYVKPYPLV